VMLAICSSARSFRHAEPDRTERAGPYGILQTLADGIKLFFKEDCCPIRQTVSCFKLAPYLALLPALLIFTIVPVGGSGDDRTPHSGAAGGRSSGRHSVPSRVVVGVGSTRRCSRAGPPAPVPTPRSIRRVSADDLLQPMGLTIAMVVIVTHRVRRGRSWIPGSELLSLEHLPPRNTALPAVRGGCDHAELNRPPFDLTEGSRSRGRVPHRVLVAAFRACSNTAEFMTRSPCRP